MKPLKRRLLAVLRHYVPDEPQNVPLTAVPAPDDTSASNRVERMKDEFVSVVSHELRTPLTSIRGALGLLAGDRVGELPESAHRVLDIAIANADRLVRLLDDILDIERMESGCITLTRQFCAARDLAERAVGATRSAAQQAGISIELVTCAAMILGDRNRLVQALSNLISNAIKFSEPGTRVVVTASTFDDQVQFTVEDHGRGIPLAKLGSIFDRFQQVDASDSRDKGGSGLGLAISKSIVRQHDGRIWCESQLGRGSRFSFTVPRADVQARTTTITFQGETTDVA
jgi:signal transduction histidine kinase